MFNLYLRSTTIYIFSPKDVQGQNAEYTSKTSQVRHFVCSDLHYMYLPKWSLEEQQLEVIDLSFHSYASLSEHLRYVFLGVKKKVQTQMIETM